MVDYTNQPTVSVDFIQPETASFDEKGNVIEGPRNGLGQPISIGFSGGGLVTATYANCFASSQEQHEYRNWLGSRCNGGFRFVNVPVFTDWSGPFPYQNFKPVPRISGIPHGSWGVGELKSGDFTGTYDPDDVSVSRASTATYFDASGKLVTAAANELRIDHDPVTGAVLGALIEDEAENLLIYSEEFDQSSAWTAINSSFVADQIAAPDGNTTADKFIESSGDSTHEFFYAGSATVTAHSNYAGGLFIKAAGRTKGVLQYVAPGGLTGVNCIFDLTAKTFSSLAFGTATLADAGLDDVGGGWFRVWVSGKIDATSTSGGMVIILADDDGNTTYTGDGTSGLYVWGAQLEAGTKPTSYIRTTSAPVTRAADTLTLNASGGNDWTLIFGDDSTQEFNNWVGSLPLKRGTINRQYLKSFQTSLTTPPTGPTALFSDGSGYEQPTAWGQITEAAALNAGVLSIQLFGAARPLRWSDWFSIYHPTKGWRAYRVWEIRDTDNSDPDAPIYTVAITPPLREAVAVDDRAEFDRPRCVMKFAADFTLPFELDQNRFSKTTIKFVEAW